MRAAARRRVLAALLLLAPLAAGCMQAPGAAPRADGALVAFMDAPAEHGPNRTLLVLREGGAADRLTYLADGTWLPRLAPGLGYAPDDLAALFREAPATPQRGGLVLRVERGHVPDAARAGLAPFLQGEWPAPFLPPDGLHPWYRPVVLARAEPPAATQAPPDAVQHAGAEHAALVDLAAAFARAAEAFVPERVEDAALPHEQPWDGCLRASTRATPQAARVGEAVEVRAEVENCGATDALLDPAACSTPPAAHVQVSGTGRPILAVLPASEAPHAAYALDLVCRGDAEALRIPAGGRAVLTRRWNGSIAACDAQGCAYRPAEPGEYHLFTFASGQRETAPAPVTLVAPDAPQARLLLVREQDWVNASTEAPIHASFGPHCAPVRYTLDPPAVTVWHHDDAPEVGEALVVRDWRGGERPERAVTMSADLLSLHLFRDGAATLASPFDAGLPLARVTLEGDAFLVNDTRVAPGERHVERYEHVLERDGGTYRVASVLTFENVGAAPLLWARAGGCA